MRHKILIIALEPQRVEIEKNLEEFFTAGGEVFFAEKKEEIDEVIAKEHPQLIFMDVFFLDNESRPNGQIIFISDQPLPDEDYLLKPLSAKAVIEKIHSAFGHLQALPQMPPM